MTIPARGVPAKDIPQGKVKPVEKPKKAPRKKAVEETIPSEE